MTELLHSAVPPRPTGDKDTSFGETGSSLHAVIPSDSDRCAAAPYPWIVRTSALVNHYYFYCVDRDFGPFFLKFCSYFPYTGKLCLNGHEWLKRQLSLRSIDFVPLDNGILSCRDPRRLQQLADSLDARRIDTLLRHWLSTRRRL